MQHRTRYYFIKGNNVIVILFVFTQFQMSVVCNLHGFSPQGNVSSDAAHVPAPPSLFKRNSPSFYNSFNKKFYEKTYQYSRNGDILTREIRIKQGKLRGFIKEFKNNKLKNVEVFLGLPYAAPPVNAMRFMPPGSPPSWNDVRVFDEFGAACPQTPPDLHHEPFKTMNPGYFNRIKGLVPFLVNQSEDCLHLNIYAPLQDSKTFKKYPVIVYIHGESFEWNSGNPYDGSVLASYGKVVLITLNFRLGILGFLRPGLSDHTVSNFGLLDQIAALQWIKDNIEEFGGDSSSVTLMGHGTGAACINFLMVSPVSMASQGLFHKAILMSGTALADWALTQNPLQYTIQVAEALNCPLIDKNDELANCLRRKRLSDIMSVKVTVPPFQTPFGPIVDGSVVPNTPHQVMGVYQNLFTRYDLMYGITEWEIYHSLDPVSLTYGMLEGERNEFLRKYMYSRYEALPFFALAKTLSEYLDWRKGIPPAKSAAEEHRDLVLDLLSDARFAAPLIQMAIYHSKINPKSYLYIFQHKSKMGEFAGSEKSVSGEEIAYVFGSPLVNEESPLSHHKFSPSEQLLSESILTYFTNFAKTGNPNAPRRLEYLTQGPKEWKQFEVYWPEYDPRNQSYLSFGIPPHVNHYYRSEMTRYWNEILPNLLSNPTNVSPQKPEISLERERESSFKNKLFSSSPDRSKEKSTDPWTYGVMRMSPKEYEKERKPLKGEDENSSWKQMDRPQEETSSDIEREQTLATSSFLPYFAALAVCLVIVNFIVISWYCYNKKKPRTNASSKPKTNKKATKDLSHNQCKILGEEEVEELEEHSERIKTESKKEKLGGVKKLKMNSSENKNRIKNWVWDGVFNKPEKPGKNVEGGNSFETKNPLFSSSVSEKNLNEIPMPKSILKNSQRFYQSNEDLKSSSRKNVQKVSVGIDATPSTRGDSVLKQTPIEITKSLDRGFLRLESVENVKEEILGSPRRSRTSISLQMLPTGSDVKFVTSEQTKTEPKNTPRMNFSSFTPNYGQDINVTSRDSNTEIEFHGDPLENIQKRNFPKVLPDFPETKTPTRVSFPQGSGENKFVSPPPPPPPVRVSTLQRKNNQTTEKENLVEKPKPTTDDESSSSTSEEKSNSSKCSIISKPVSKNTGKREPKIVIQPRIGPKQKEIAQKTTHVNLQKKDDLKPRTNVQNF